MRQGSAIKRAGWLATVFLFGVWALAFAFLFHWLGPKLWKEGSSWWHIFHWLLILPLACMLVAAFLGAAVDLRPIFPTGLKQRLRLCAPSATAWLWAPALSGFMHGGNWADLLAVAGSWFALWKEKTRQTWCFAAMLTAHSSSVMRGSFSALCSLSGSLFLLRSTASSGAISGRRTSWASLYKGPGGFLSTMLL